MIGEQIQCEYAHCDVVFTKKTHNQKYHNGECTRLATNAHIMKKYYDRRAQRLGLPRFCDSCQTKLSRYNSNSVCNSCQLQREVKKNESVLNMVSNSVTA